MSSTTVPTAVATLIDAELVRKDFSTGSRGFHATGKVTVDGTRYQTSAMAILIGSKADPSAVVNAETADAASAVAGVVLGMTPKVFSSGKTGFYAQAKVIVAEQRYQVSTQAVALV